MQPSVISQMSSLALTKTQGKAGKEQLEQLDRNISPPKKIFITKQILIKTGLVSTPPVGRGPGMELGRKIEGGGH